MSITDSVIKKQENIQTAAHPLAIKFIKYQ